MRLYPMQYPIFQDKRYGGLEVLLKTENFYSKEFCYEEVHLKHDIFDFDTFETNPMVFYVVATDVDTEEAVYHKLEDRNDHGFEWIRASASVPMFLQMVEINGARYLDGALADSIPVRYFEGLGYDRNIIILTQPKGFRKRKDKAFPLMNLKYRDYPELVQTMEKRHIRYNQTLSYISQKEQKGKLLVIRPDSPLPVSRTEKNPEKLRQAYEMGRQEAERRKDEIKDYLKLN